METNRKTTVGINKWTLGCTAPRHALIHRSVLVKHTSHLQRGQNSNNLVRCCRAPDFKTNKNRQLSDGIDAFSMQECDEMVDANGRPDVGCLRAALIEPGGKTTGKVFLGSRSDTHTQEPGGTCQHWPQSQYYD